MEGAPKRRLIAFRIVAGLSVLLSLLTFAFAGTSFSEEGSLHRVHNLSMGIVVLLMMTVPLILSTRSPESYVASFRVWLALCLAGVVAGILNGDLLQPEGYLITTLLGVVTYLLNPAMKEVNRCIKADVSQLVLGAVALVPAFIFALSQSDLQKAGDPAINEHVEFHHYSGAGWVALSIGLAAIAASFPAQDRMIASRSVGAAVILLGALSMAYPDFEGAYDTPWAAATIAFGIVYIAIGEIAAKKGAAASSSGSSSASAEMPS